MDGLLYFPWPNGMKIVFDRIAGSLQSDESDFAKSVA